MNKEINQADCETIIQILDDIGDVVKKINLGVLPASR